MTPAADDDQALGQLVAVQQLVAGDHARQICAGDRGHRGGGTGGDEDVFCLQLGSVGLDPHPAGVHDGGRALDHGNFICLHQGGDAAPELLHHRVLAGLKLGHVAAEVFRLQAH